MLEMYYLGITAGTSATTFSPDNPVTRGQAAVFVAKGVDQALARSSRRAALGQWWQPHDLSLSILRVEGPGSPAFDGESVWVPLQGGRLQRIHASDGKPTEAFDGAPGGYSALVAMGRVFVTGFLRPGKLYMLDPAAPSPAIVSIADVGNDAAGIAFDGSRIWTANSGGSVSIVTPTMGSWSVATVTAGFVSPAGIAFDGANMWVTDPGAGALMKLDSSGAIVQSVSIGRFPGFPAYDGSNLWVPDLTSNTVTVVRSSDGAVLRVLSGNGLSSPVAVAFDGERMLVTGNVLSLWRAADLAPLVSASHATLGLTFACSDGVNFWVTFVNSGEIARF